MEIELKYLLSKTPKKYDKTVRINEIFFDTKNKTDVLKTIFPDNVVDNTIEGNVRYAITKPKNSMHPVAKFIVTVKTNNNEEYEEIIDKNLSYNILNQSTIGSVNILRYITKISNTCTVITDDYKNIDSEKEKAIICKAKYTSTGIATKDYIIEKEIDKTIKDKLEKNAINVSNNKAYSNENLKSEFNQTRLDILFGIFKRQGIKN